MPSASPSPLRRLRISPLAVVGVASAPQMANKAACNSRKTALAPTTVVPMAISADRPGPLTRARAASARPFITLASSSPTIRSR